MTFFVLYRHLEAQQKNRPDCFAKWRTLSVLLDGNMRHLKKESCRVSISKVAHASIVIDRRGARLGETILGQTRFSPFVYEPLVVVNVADWLFGAYVFMVLADNAFMISM